MDERLAEALDKARTTGHFAAASTMIPDGLPAELASMENLTSIYVVGPHLRELPPWLAELPALTHLEVVAHRLAAFPPVLTKMRSLRSLAVAAGNLVKLPDEPGELLGLKELILSDARLRTLPDWIAELSCLERLDIGGNNLDQLPSVVAGKPIVNTLKILEMWGNRFREVPETVGNLGALEYLDVSAAGIGPDDELMEYFPRGWPKGSNSPGILARLPTWLPSALPELRGLCIDGQLLHSLPEALYDMSNLRCISAKNNRISQFPEGLHRLRELRYADFSENRIQSVRHPDSLAKLTKLQRLKLAGNPLDIPPEILQSGSPSRIIEYLAQVGRDRRSLDEAKLLVVGEGSVGKTSIVNRLVGKGFAPDEQITEGIEVTPWKPDSTDIQINIWDFGGQEIMHATHQFFLTKRSAYLLVVDARQGEEQNRLEYWLKLISSFSGGSPVVIVGNKCDQAPLDLDQRGLREKYPEIVAIIEVSAATGRNVSDLASRLVAIISELPHVRDLLPASFFEVKRELESIGGNFISFDEYQAICRRFDVGSVSLQESLIGFLHDLGTVLCFRDDPRLSDTNILNPSWVTGGVYRILNSNLAAQRKGLLTWPEIDKILDDVDYPSGRRTFIVDMMKRFELCFESEGKFLIPDLITKEEPDTGSWSDALNFEIVYDVLPGSVVSRLIVRMNELISKRTLWRTGVVLTMDGNRALVKGDPTDGVLTIQVDGPPAGRRGLLTAIRGHLRAIERTIPGLSVNERVPVPGHRGLWVSYEHLVRLEAHGKTTVIPEGVVQEFEVSELLNGIERRQDRRLPARELAVVPEPEAPEPAGKPESRFGVFGGLLLAVLALGAVAFFAGAKVLDSVWGGIAGMTIAVVITVAFGLLLLRAMGLVTEKGLLDGLKEALGRLPSAKKDE
jgi:internalin A